jgi:hypothetical protein
MILLEHNAAKQIKHKPYQHHKADEEVILTGGLYALKTKKEQQDTCRKHQACGQKYVKLFSQAEREKINGDENHCSHKPDQDHLG